MPLKHLSESKKQALIDLAMLAMYADGHLAMAEDQRVHRLLETLGFATEYEQNRQYDASIARVRRQAQTKEEARLQAVALAGSFSDHEERRLVQSTLEDLIASDQNVAPQESSLLSLLREAFGP